MSANRIIACALGAFLLTGCSTMFPGTLQSRETAKVTKAQSCAIGYDLARQVYNIVDIRKTAIQLSPRLGPCAKHAANYLRRAGYAVDETAQRINSHQFSVATSNDPDGNGVIATATLPGLKITRAYGLGDNGVYLLSPVSVVYHGGL